MKETPFQKRLREECERQGLVNHEGGVNVYRLSRLVILKNPDLDLHLSSVDRTLRFFLSDDPRPVNDVWQAILARTLEGPRDFFRGHEVKAREVQTREWMASRPNHLVLV